MSISVTSVFIIAVILHAFWNYFLRAKTSQSSQASHSSRKYYQSWNKWITWTMMAVCCLAMYGSFKSKLYLQFLLVGIYMGMLYFLLQKPHTVYWKQTAIVVDSVVLIALWLLPTSVSKLKLPFIPKSITAESITAESITAESITAKGIQEFPVISDETVDVSVTEAQNLAKMNDDKLVDFKSNYVMLLNKKAPLILNNNIMFETMPELMYRRGNKLFYEMNRDMMFVFYTDYEMFKTDPRIEYSISKKFSEIGIRRLPVKLQTADSIFVNKNKHSDIIQVKFDTVVMPKLANVRSGFCIYEPNAPSGEPKISIVESEAEAFYESLKNGSTELKKTYIDSLKSDLLILNQDKNELYKYLNKDAFNLEFDINNTKLRIFVYNIPAEPVWKSWYDFLRFADKTANKAYNDIAQTALDNILL